MPDDYSTIGARKGIFIFEVDGLTIGEFLEVSGLKVEIDVVTVEEGGENGFVHKLPGRMTWPNLNFKRGVTNDDTLLDWIQKCSGDGFSGQGNKLVFGTTFGYMEPMLKVAADNAGIKFEHATGYKTAPNMRTYDSRTYEGAYMAGVIAGSMTKTNTLGVVGSIPIPEVIRNINSFTMGAQSVNPKIKTKVVWVNEWFNPPKETEAATALINGGADVLMQNTDSSAVLQTAEKMGKRAFGWDSDMTAYGPKAHLGSAVINWAPYYIKATKDALDGKWETGQSWWGVKEGAIDMVSVAADVPEAAKKKVEEVKAGLKAGTFHPWTGPIVGQDGKEVLAKDAKADDKFLGGIKFYVKGVEGKVPGDGK